MILTGIGGPTRTGRIQAVVATLLVNDYDVEPSEYISDASSDARHGLPARGWRQIRASELLRRGGSDEQQRPNVHATW